MDKKNTGNRPLPPEEQNLNSGRKNENTKNFTSHHLVRADAWGGVVSGCGGPDTEIRQQNNDDPWPELTDLDAAYKKGLITEKEYQKAKRIS